MSFYGANPIFPVDDLDLAVEYYQQKLGFRLDWGDKWLACVSCGRCAIFLALRDQGNPGTWVWIGCEDATAVHDEMKANGAKIRHGLSNYPWAYEFQVEDLDGNVLRIGSGPLKDKPPGEWFDMEEVRWAPTPEGGWVRVDATAAEPTS